MAPPLILVGSEYTVHRQVVTYGIETLRPDFAVRGVIPGEMDAAVRSQRPWLVICSTLIHAIEEIAQAWIILPLDGDEGAQVSVQGQRQHRPLPTLSELLAIIDELWLALEPGRADLPPRAGRGG